MICLSMFVLAFIRSHKCIGLYAQRTLTPLHIGMHSPTHTWLHKGHRRPLVTISIHWAFSWFLTSANPCILIHTSSSTHRFHHVLKWGWKSRVRVIRRRESYDFFLFLLTLKGFEVGLENKPLNFCTMNNTSSILKHCSKAVNQASFSPTAQRKARAVKLLAELTKSITELKTLEVKPKANKKNLAKLTKAELIAMLKA